MASQPVSRKGAPDGGPEQDRRALRILLASLTLCLAYAVVRYHVFGGVAWARLPLFVLNKAVSFASVLVLAWCYLSSERGMAKRLGLAGFGLAALHSLMSMALLIPKNYPKLFQDDALNLAGEIAVLCGCIPLLIWAMMAVLSVPSVAEGLPPAHTARWRAAGYWALGLTGVHVAAMGWTGWLEPGKWHGGMPPITMLSALVVLAPLIRKAVRGLGPAAAQGGRA